MWQLIGARATGTSHVATSAPCQDREGFRVVDDADGGEAAIAVICDGAGSASLSDLGAELVCEAFRTKASGFVCERGTNALTRDDLVVWLEEIQERIAALAEAENAAPRDFACTLLFLAASEQKTICAQVGDGAIVLNDGECLEVAHWPENGEYANQTFFVSEGDAQEHLQFASFGPVRDFVVFSDGLQRLALNESERRPHVGFFRPLFDTVRAAYKLDRTKNELEAFLSSDRVNSKTDDDKSIVIGCRVD